MKFATRINGSTLETVKVDTVIMTEQELYGLQQLPGKGAYTLGSIVVVVKPSPEDAQATRHVPIEHK